LQFYDAFKHNPQDKTNTVMAYLRCQKWKLLTAFSWDHFLGIRTCFSNWLISCSLGLCFSLSTTACTRIHCYSLIALAMTSTVASS